MQLKPNAFRLHETARGVETMSRFALAVLSLASGVYTYLGVRGLLDGSATFVFFAAIVYSAAVSVAIYAFWTYMMRFVPLVVSGTQRIGLFFTMAIGCAMIIAMSSWLNAAALAGSAALEQHMAVTLQGYAEDLDQAHANALASQSLLPDVQRAAERFAALAQDERESGALTGTQGSGSVVQLLSQMSLQMNQLAATISGSRGEVTTLFTQGSERLATMRELVSTPGAIEPRSDNFQAEAVQLSAIIAALQQTDVAASVKRAAADLSAGFIAPVADGRSAELANRQDQVMETVRTSVAAQSTALSAAADEILATPKVEQRRFVPLSSAEAVIRYWGDFIPSWAGAISIDLLPVVLVLVLMIVNDAMRREAETLKEAETITAAEMLRAMTLYRRMEAEGLTLPSVTAPVVQQPDNEVATEEPKAAEAAVTPAPAGTDDGTVTPIETAQRKRGDGPRPA
ncbi:MULTISPECIES: hypothetical protein [Devosia]|uniref:DUF4407 domain-containing protein n=1 Tax=Devosia equisanguinis TaxID=2490941 RepID=A0A447IAG8_9HYPH|nr:MULTISPECIES: hypothetical protein [Devosia]ODT49485.1 MAG: hypothetical protein ABS74_08245 [Pelagibacterium sp. SCN 63-126]ODU81692.1 MAG: hypothetical protein ABT14_17680 [Pelagibacterium sp. SCN 63-17]OJX41849.1 MAG: hypothetical protein BGO80_09745 [Devosia sp. 63-57]VDS04428.1 hypothetical protein DEVEQU_01564 [Devosia equisanguinis]